MFFLVYSISSITQEIASALTLLAPRNDTLIIEHDGPSPYFKIALTGRGAVAPKFEIRPNVYNFYRISRFDSDNASDWRIRATSTDKGALNPGQ